MHFYYICFLVLVHLNHFLPIIQMVEYFTDTFLLLCKFEDIRPDTLHMYLDVEADSFTFKYAFIANVRRMQIQVVRECIILQCPRMCVFKELLCCLFIN